MELDGCAVIIPALDEEASLPLVLADLERLGLLGSTIVVDNGSRDATARIAREGGAHVAEEPRRGYGAACLRGLEALPLIPRTVDIVVFMDADHSDDASLIPDLVRPVRAGLADLVIGSRASGNAAPGSLKVHQRIGNAAMCVLIRLLFDPQCIVEVR